MTYRGFWFHTICLFAMVLENKYFQNPTIKKSLFHDGSFQYTVFSLDDIIELLDLCILSRSSRDASRFSFWLFWLTWFGTHCLWPRRYEAIHRCTDFKKPISFIFLINFTGELVTKALLKYLFMNAYSFLCHLSTLGAPFEWHWNDK